MEPREPRNKVLVKARMQCGAQWRDVCILNYSAHGLGMACDAAPPHGTYLEIRRGPYIIVARVAWVRGHRFGARTQDPVSHVAIVGKVAPAGRSADCGGPVERRLAPRAVKAPIRHESRHLGRAMEFGSVVLALAAGAAALGQSAHLALAAPIARIVSVLGR